MSDYGSIILHDSSFNKTELVSLQRLGWLPSSYNILENSLPEEQYQTLGVNPESLMVEALKVSSPCIVVTKRHLSNSQDCFIKENCCLLSTSLWSKVFPLVNRTVLLCSQIVSWTVYLMQKLGVVSLVSGHGKCGRMSDVGYLDLCSDCQINFCSTGHAGFVCLCLALKELSRGAPEFVKNCMGQESREVLSKLSLDFATPHEVKVFVAEKAIDSGAILGSEYRKWLEKTSKSVYLNKSKITREYKSRPGPAVRLPTFIAARRWNSWTPVLPAGKKGRGLTGIRRGSEILGRKTGGGYFVSDGTTSIVIDPGYGFLELLFDFYGITVLDIDSVIITHDHPDHWAELPNILALRKIYKDDSVAKKLSIFLNPSSFYLHERLLEYYCPLLEDGKPRPMVPNEHYACGSISFDTIGMEHEEIVDSCNDITKDRILKPSGPVGLLITGSSPHIHRNNNNRFSFVIVGDTSFPKNSSILKKLHFEYGEADIAAIHLGSIEKGWSNRGICDASKIEYDRGPRDLGKHLGVNGCVKMILLLRPRVSVITEFGAELDSKSHRTALTETIRCFASAAGSVVLPSDIGLIMVMKGDEIYGRCMSCNETVPYYVPIKLINCKESSGYLHYAYEGGCGSKLYHCTLETLECSNGVGFSH